jgi:photosystem II stability/assembly factor-like uncharacterized protein
VKRHLALGASLAALALATAAAAAPPPDDAFQQLHWRSIGPFRGGRTIAGTGVPGEPEHFYFGAVNGGVWETLNAGRTWAPIADSIPNGSIGAIAVAPSDHKTIYVGTGEADMRSSISQGIGLFKSTDGGRTWGFIGLQDSQQIGKILVDPRDPNVVIVAALGHPYGPNETRGVFRSQDGGRTWTKTLYRGPDIGASDLAFEPGNPDVVYASLWHTRRPPWNVYPAAMGPGGGVWKSTDGGRSWKPLTAGLPADPGKIGLAVAPSRPNRVYAEVDAKGGAGGLYRSEDRGESWTRVSTDPRVFERGWYFGRIAVDPKNPDVVYAPNIATYRSEDGGKTFLPYKGAPGGDDYHDMWIDSADGARQLIVSDQGAIVTLDGGRSWSSWFNQPTAQFYHVVTDNRFPYMVYGAQQDSGAAGVPSRTGSINGVDMTNFRETTAGGESDNIAPDPEDPDTIFGGRVDKLDLKTGQTRSVDPTLALPDHYRGTWTLPLVFSKRDPHALYFANQRIWRTKDGGSSWTPVSPDLTREQLVVPPNLDAATAADVNEKGPRRGVVYAIAPSPVTDGLIWAGTDDGLVWRTTDDGKHWENVTPKGLQPWSKIGVVEASHFDPQTAYIAVDRHRLDDFRPYVFRTRDGGRTWTPIVKGLIGDGPLNSVNVVREDPGRTGLLYAGTERGVFVSFDDGDSWRPLQQDLPATSVRDIEVKGNDLVIATFGRGFYVMDDVETLHELPATQAPSTHLFRPATAVRLRPLGFTGTPHPKDEPEAANPPDGAYLDYYLDHTPKGPVEIAIYDGKEALVRRFSSTDKPAGPDLKKLKLTGDWFAVARPPAASKGMHRLVWDLHYAAAPAEEGEDYDPSARGVWAPPGTYVVELKVDGETLRQSLEVAPDPRIKAAPETYAEEFALARRAETGMARARAALEEASKLRTRLAEAAKTKAKAKDGKRKGQVEALQRRLAQLTGVDAPAPSTTDLTFLAGALRVQLAAIDGADGGPSPDARTGLEHTSAALDRTLADWKALKAEADATLASSGVQGKS